MAVAYVNGHSRHNGHHFHDTEPVERIVFDPEPEVKPCALRLGHGSWCNLPDGHEGEHHGAPPVYGPLEERPRLWRQQRGLIKP